MSTPHRPHRTILIVEDDPHTRGMLERIMSDAGYQPTSANDGTSGARLALTGQFDAILIDHELPGISGIEAITQLRRHGISTPVLMISAYSGVADIAAAHAAGANDYLTKPFDVDDLLTQLQHLLR